MLNLCALGGVRGPFVLVYNTLHNVQCACHSPHVAHIRKPRYRNSTTSTASSSWCCCCGVLLVFVSGSSSVDNVLGVLSFLRFPFVDCLRSNKPCTTVLQIRTLNDLRFFIFRKIIQVVFPSIGWSSCSPLGLRRCGKHPIPLSGCFGPPLWILGGDPQGLSPLQILVCFNPNL